MVSHDGKRGEGEAPELPAWLSCPDASHIRLQLQVQAGAKRSQVAGEHAGSLKLKIAAPPVEGAANKAMIGFLAKALGVRQQAVKIVRGELSKHKLVEVGMEQAAAKIADVLACLADKSS